MDVKTKEAEKIINREQLYTYYSFSGADMVISVEDVVIGEIQKIRYNTITKELQVDCIDFINVVNKQENMAEVSKCYNIMTSLKNAKIKIMAANEYGHKRYREIRGVNYIGEKGSPSIDDCVTINTYIYTFNELSEPLNINRDISCDDLIKNSDILFKEKY